MAIPGTSAGGMMGYGGMMRSVAPEGTLTSTVYSLIRDEKYGEATKILLTQLESFPRSRAALSLLGYCLYMQADFRSAAQCYEELNKFYPEVESYRLYYAQCLHRAGLYPEATKACLRVDSEQHAQRLLQLQAAIKYEEDDLPASRTLLEQCVQDDPDTIVNRSCIAYKEGRYDEAKAGFAEAMQATGYQPLLAYNVALCHYANKQYGAALKTLGEVIERGVRNHPELSVGSATDGVEVRSVGNTPVLRETALVEAFNLKAAIEFNMKNLEAAREALSDMPPRGEEELDAVTLHNTGLVGMDADPTTGFRKLNFLLSSPPFPPETFGNLLLLYVKYGCYDLAADVMAENAHLTFKYLSPELYEFLDATIMVATSPEEAYRKYDVLTAKHIEALRKHTKAIQDARLNRDNEGIKAALKLYDDALEKYIPVLMGAARIYWDRGNYAQVERIFRQSAEFASEHEVWKLNVAHTFFMQESKYREAIRYYAPIVKEAMDTSAANAAAGGGMMGGGGIVKGGLLDIPAIVLANLCVSYIMTSQNEEAEEIMRRVEADEAAALADSAAAQQAMAEGGGMVVGGAAGMLPPGARNGLGKPVFHLCIINLVIGTLYCSKGNYEFGVSRVLKSLEPLDRKLGPDTWYYAKRCFVALAEVLAKHMITVKDSTFEEILSFLADCDRAGKNIVTVIAQGSANATMMPAAMVAGGAPGADGSATNPDGSPAAGEPSAADNATANAFSSAAAAAAALLPGLLGNGGSRTVSYEARLLRRMYMVLRDEH